MIRRQLSNTPGKGFKYKVQSNYINQVQHALFCFTQSTKDVNVHTSTKLLTSNLTPDSFSPPGVAKNSTGLL